MSGKYLLTWNDEALGGCFDESWVDDVEKALNYCQTYNQNYQPGQRYVELYQCVEGELTLVFGVHSKASTHQ